MIDELQLFDLALAVFVVVCNVIGLAIYMHPQRRPIPAKTLHRINRQIEAGVYATPREPTTPNPGIPERKP